MGLFSVPAKLVGPTGRTEQLDLLVDTGALFLVLPKIIAERLELVPLRSIPLHLAGGERVLWPVAEVRLTLQGNEMTTPCLIAPDGAPLLGCVPLEIFLLGVDPVNRRLVPIEATA